MINSGLAKKGQGFQELFKFCYEYRRKAVANGEETPIMDFVIFRSLRKIFGGRLKFIATGEDAILSTEYMSFTVRNVLCSRHSILIKEEKKDMDTIHDLELLLRRPLYLLQEERHSLPRRTSS